MRLLACALLVISTTYATEFCEPGKNFLYYCNACVCGNDGLANNAMCTLMNCDPEVWNKDGTLKHPNEIANNPLLRETRAIKENEDTCEPGKLFRYYCNSCFCGDDGKLGHAVCTIMNCDPEVWNRNGTLKHPSEIVNNPLLRKTREIEENEDTCEPGKQFSYYCNSCFCGDDGKVGHSACTRMSCDPKIWNKDGSLKHTNEIANNPLLRETRAIKENEDTCEPGKLFRYYCNSCFCGDDGKVGHAVCTIMNCDPEVWNRNGTLKHPSEIVNNPLLRKTREIEEIEDTCKPGKRFQHYCNSCFCGDDGKVAHSTCTRMYCDPKIWNKDGTLKHPIGISASSLLRETREVEENQDTCEPGKRFRYYCNSCSCGNNGKIAHSVCTKMYCDPELWNKNGTLKYPTEIATNTLLREERDTEERCEPGKSFMDYCNRCVCGFDGRVSHSVCTFMLCDPAVWNKDGTPKSATDNLPLLRNQRSIEFLCQPGKVYKNSCNTCLCSKDGKTAACTQMLCPPRHDELVAPKVCEPEKHFKIDCNQCICSKDGLKVACTQMACFPPNNLRIKKSAPVADAPTFCKPNTSFKRDCNTCICNKDGSSAVCTLKACL